jgi:hypothetical protein
MKSMFTCQLPKGREVTFASALIVARITYSYSHAGGFKIAVDKEDACAVHEASAILYDVGGSATDGNIPDMLPTDAYKNFKRGAITLNAEQKLYVIPCMGGCTCLGFDVCFERTQAIARELSLNDLTPKEDERGTLNGYLAYLRACDIAAAHCKRTGYRMRCELTLQLIGLEGKTVEVVDKHGETRRFTVGKSTGWMPCHLELETRNAMGGGSVTGAPFKSIRVIR